MSQENVEIIRRAYDAFNRGDIPAILMLMAPDVEWHLTDYAGWLESDVYHGLDGVGRFLGDWATIFPDNRTTIDRLVDHGAHVVVFVTQRGHGTGSGAAAELRYTQIVTLRAGKVCQVQMYSDEAAALRAVGLAE